MASADLNQDGHGDLVVGAPGYSLPGRYQIGRVYVIYGNDLGLPPIDLDLDKEAHWILEGCQVRPPITCFPRVSKPLVTFWNVIIGFVFLALGVKSRGSCRSAKRSTQPLTLATSTLLLSPAHSPSLSSPSLPLSTTPPNWRILDQPFPTELCS